MNACERDTEQLKTSKQNLKNYLRENYIRMLKKDLNSVSSPLKENISLV